MIVNQLIIKLKDTIVMEITKNKITEIFCIIDDFCQEYDKEIARMSICEPDGRKHRNRKWTMSRSEIMTILIYFHFNTFRNFKHYWRNRQTLWGGCTDANPKLLLNDT